MTIKLLASSLTTENQGAPSMRLRGILFSLLLPTAAIADVSPDWSHFPGYFLPGQNGIVIANVDGVGSPEAIVSGSAIGGFASFDKHHLAVLEYVGSRFATTSLRVIEDGWLSGSVQVVRGSNGAADQVVGLFINAGTLEPELVFWRGKPLLEIGRVAVPGGFRLYQVADVDGDGALEALGCLCSGGSDGPAVVLDLLTGSAEWTDTSGSSYVGAGQLDSDAALEIVIGPADGAGRIVDGASHQQQSSYLDGFRGRPVFGNFRGAASSLEFAIVEPWGVTKIFVSQPILSPVAELPTGEVRAVTVRDVNVDGNDDLIVGEGQWGSIVAYSTVNGQQLFAWQNPAHGVSAVALDNLDGIPGLEIVFGAGLTSTGVDILSVIDAGSGARRLLSADEGGPHSSVLHLDIEGDGSNEVVLATAESNSGYDGANLVVLNAESGTELRRRASVLEPWGDNPGVSMAPIEIDGNAGREILIASGYTYDGAVAVVDGSTLNDRWRVTLQDIPVILDVATMRFNGDAIDDAVIAAPNRFLVLDGRNGNELYRSVSFNVTAESKLAVGNADSDPQTEVAFSVGGNVFIVDPTLGLVESSATVNGTIQSMRFESLQGSCRLTVMLGTRLDRLDCASGLVASSRPLGMTATYVDYPTDSTGDLLVSDGKRVGRLTGAVLVSRSRAIGTGIGSRNRGAFSMQGDKIVAYVGGDQSVNRITLPLETAIFADGLEDR